jgi:hypothetical protein
VEAKVDLVADVTMEAIVVRCGCADEATGKRIHGDAGRPCPTPRRIEALGEIAREHFEGEGALDSYYQWSRATGLTMPHVEKKLGGKR